MMAGSRSSRITKDLKIVFFNANGITRQLHEFGIFLHTHSIDVAMINETRISASTELTIPNYTTYRKETRRHYGGVAILIKSRLPHRFVDIFNFQTIEIVTIEIFVNNEAVLIGSVYHPPGRKLDKEEYLEILNINQGYIYAGDFNAKN